MTDVFTPKPFAHIAADMIERMRSSTDRVTDFNVGSVVRSLLEVPSAELEEFYQEVYFGLLRAIPTAIYIGFSYTLRQAVAARGAITITRETADAALTIPAGTELQSTRGASYLLDADVVLDVGATEATATITATAVGTIGNTDQESVAFVGVSGATATNPAAIDSGIDQETEEQRAERFARFILSLARGTVSAIQYAVSEAEVYHPITGLLSERVQNVAMDEVPGYVTVWIHNGADGASAALTQEVERRIEGYETADGELVSGYRAAGVEVVVRTMGELSVDVTLELITTTGAVRSDTEAAIISQLTAWLKDVASGSVIRPVDIINEVFVISGVSDVTLIEPSHAITVGASQVARLGVLTWAE